MISSIRSVFLSVVFLTFTAGSAFAQNTGSIAGQVSDSVGAVVAGATVTAVAPGGKETQATTNNGGVYTITGLTAGVYTVRAIATGFGLYENVEVTITAGQRSELAISLSVAEVEESVEVGDDAGVSTDADNNKSATVIKGADLDALPDDPDELEAALQALAGASAGPNGGQIYIDGFTGGRLPPKDSIREVRINQNPFSAEFDRLGFGRIEILTKPGSDKWRGQAFMNFNDESLNSRNPFAVNRAPSQTRFFGGNVSGPVKKGKSSFFLDINNRDIDNNSVINALVLDPTLNIVNVRQDVRVPTQRFSIGPRFDYAINEKNTLVLRYNFSRSTSENQGLNDGLSLPSRAFETSSREHEFRLTETMIINATTVNETRFEYSDNKQEQNGDNSTPTINVVSAFIGGGSQIGNSFNRNKTWELNNFTVSTFGKNAQHTVKFGGKLRHVSVSNRSENNYGGTFVFTGVPATEVTPVISPIEQYQAEVGGNPALIYNPTQFSITTGDPLAGVSQYETGLFITDDWKVSPALLLSFGLRYENQTNISSKLNFAPRFGFAWSPGAGGAKAPKTVFRGGAGIFYERFNESFTLQAERFDGVTQLNLFVSANDPDPDRRAAALLLLAQPVFTQNGVTNVPTTDQILAALGSQSSTIRQVSPNLQAPYTIQGAIGLERQLPFKTTLAAFFISSRTLHTLRSLNINAPICPSINNCVGGERPDPSRGNIYEYESSGTIRQNQMILNFRSNLSPKFSLFGNYRLGFAKGDTDGANSFPSYTYDFSNDFGRSSFDIRHSFIIGGNFVAPWGVTFNPFIQAMSGRPFNITRGVDSNGDSQLTERPTFGQLRDRCIELNLTNSFCDIGGNDPNAILPRNYGQAPSYFAVNMRISRNFGFGGGAPVQTADSGRQGGGSIGTGGIPGTGRGGRGGGGGNRGGGGFGGGDNRAPYNLNVGVQVTNLFNNVNFNAPVGSLSSSRFGQSTSTAFGFGGFGPGGGFGGGLNRRVELQMRFTF